MPNTVYFDRRLGTPDKPFSGDKTFVIPMPCTPEILELHILNLNSESGYEGFELDKIELAPLITRDLVITKKAREFVEFAIPFCEQAGYMDEGVYHNSDESIMIVLLNQIRNRDTGVVLNTPARVSRLSGIMEVNLKKFQEYTIPMRMLILLHERMHYILNTRDEVEADLNALRIYLAYGFPQTESIYATANLFNDKPEMIDRVKKIIAFIKDFDPQVKRRTAKK